MTLLPQRWTLDYVMRMSCLLLALAIAFNLFWLGSKPVAVNLIPAPWDKLAHFAVFSALTVLVWIGTRGRMPLAVMVAVISLGALDELHQGTLPGRHADVLDFLTDVLAGTLTGCLLLARTRSQMDGDED
jgi:hypothetical protein